MELLFHMLRIHTTKAAAAAKAYYAREDFAYYAEGPVWMPSWKGNLAKEWGIHGEAATKEQFDRLCDRLHPVTGEKLTQRTNDENRILFDFTFSAFKGPTLAALHDGRIVQAFVESIDETMDYAEQWAATRVRKNGAFENRTTGNWLRSMFLHTTTREEGGIADPFIHGHVTVFNVTKDPAEQKLKALEIFEVKRNAPFFEAYFMNAYAKRLQEIGYGVVRKGKYLELAGVSDALIDKFSRRTAKIEKVAKQLGIKDPDAKAKLGATTRQHKPKDMTWGELVAQWEGRMTPEEKESLTKLQGQPGWKTTAKDAMSFAIAHEFERASVVAEKRLYETALRYGVGSTTLEGLEKEAARQGVIFKDGQATTQEVLEEESRMIRFAREGRGTMRPAVLGAKAKSRLNARIQTAGTENHTTLNKGQQAALAKLVGSRDRVTVLDAAAGTGKTTLLSAYADQLADARNVIWLGTTSTAVKELESIGLPAMTVARFLLKPQSAKRIVVDEVSMLGHKDASRLFKIGREFGARIVLVGDGRQHKAVPRGHLMQLLHEQAGVKPVQLTGIMRQKGAYKMAVEKLADGKMKAGFQALDKLGNIRIGGHAELVTEYMRAVKQGKTALIVSPTHAEGDKVTALVREELVKEGTLYGPEREIERLIPLNLTQAEAAEYKPAADEVLLVVGKSRAAYRRGKLAVRVGETLRVTSGGQTADGKRLRTGDMLTVEGFTKEGVKTNRGVITDMKHLAYGYVATSYASQGKTVDVVAIDFTSPNFPAINKEAAYVAASRGRQRAVIVTDNKPGLFDAIERSDPRKTAHELLGHRAARYRKQRFAFLQRLIERAREAIQVRQPTIEKGMVHER